MKSEIAAAILAVCLSVAMVCAGVDAVPLEDQQLPDTTGLFFGKRAAHPNMNNLLFGRRSYTAQLEGAKLTADDAQYICKSIRTTCNKWGIYDDED